MTMSIPSAKSGKPLTQAQSRL